MKTLTIATRNIFRNTRRSLMTISAIAIGTVAMLLFGGFVRSIEFGVEVTAIQRDGHFLISRTGFFDYGNGNPAAYGMADYRSVMRLIEADAVLRPLIVLATPIVRVFGIAGNAAVGSSQTFVGSGFEPDARARMLQWDEYNLGPRFPRAQTRLKASDPEGGVLGVGLARMLGMCKPLKLSDCGSVPHADAATGTVDPKIASISKLISSENAQHNDPDPHPPIDLLAAAASGAPNVVSLHVLGTEQQTIRELDDVYIGMPLPLAQKLLFGRDPDQATGIVVQLHHTADLPLARARLDALISRDRLPLEVHDFREIEPINVQIVTMFHAIFAFMAAIIAIIVVFMVSNTMMMSVIERTTEIGTIRALGLRRSGVRYQFIIEGFLLGLIGASIGVALSFAAAAGLNALDLTWRPPMSVEPAPFLSYLLGDSLLIPLCWASLVLVTTFAALLPANRAARMEVVEALRHV